MRKTILFLLLVLLLQCALRLPFLGVPLERDEGAYGYIGQEILRGGVEYKDTFDHKPPLLYYSYSGIIKVFGGSVFSLRIVTLFYSILTTIFVFLSAFYLLGSNIALLSAFLYVLFSGGPIVQGFMSNSETFMALPMVVSVFFLIFGVKKNNFFLFFLSGCFSVAAIFFKQTAVLNFFVIFFSFLFIDDKAFLSKTKKAFIFMVGAFFAGFVLLLFLLLRGNLLDFIYSNIALNSEYVKTNSLGLAERFLQGLEILKWQMILESGFLWAFGIGGIFALYFSGMFFPAFLLGGSILFPLFAIFVSGRFFGHYFIQMLPFLAILSGIAIAKVLKDDSLYLKTIVSIFSLFLLYSIFSFQLPFYAKFSPAEISVGIYKNEEFVDSYETAMELKKILKPEDDVFVWSANPEIYFYLNKKSPTKYFNYLYWMQNKNRGNTIIEDVKKADPDYIIRSGYSLPNEKLSEIVRKNYRFLFSNGRNVVFRKK